ncbi:MAG TPA: class I SAM-dependent methyltransferase [Pseudonocardiaceae bacterium]|nr:class I SAM-dependent methyltransferase [Pseudonocardiaceae bacterium]
MTDGEWLRDAAESYDTVADNYTDFVRPAIERDPMLRGALALFAEYVRDGGGPVADVGCGPGFMTAHLSDLGLDAFGIDLSPGMIEIARRNRPDLSFEVGSMTELALADGSVGAVLASWSVIHVPDEEIPTVFAHFHRVLRPGGVALIGFHVGDRSKIKTEGYGGLPMRIPLYHRPMDRMASWLRAAGFAVEFELIENPGPAPTAGMVLARRPVIDGSSSAR